MCGHSFTTVIDTQEDFDTAVVGRRVAQFIVDWLIIAVVNGALLALFLLSPTEQDGAIDSSAAGFWLIAAAVFVGSVAWSVFVWILRPAKRDGQTFGMTMLGLQVVAVDGSSATVGKLFVRTLLLIVDVGITPLVGLVSMFVTTRNQRIGDLAAGTVVRRTD